MQFIHGIAALPAWGSFLLLVILPTLVAVTGTLLVRRLFSVEALVENNEVAGFKFATLGVVYAVLLGLAVVSVWEKFVEAEGAAEREAAGVVSLYRLSDGVQAPNRDAIREAITAYANTVVESDWPAMARNEESRESLVALNGLYGIILDSPTDTATAAALLSASLDELAALTDARRERLSLAEGIVPEVIWLALFAGAALTIGFTFFFGLQNYSAQLLMTAMLSVTIFLALYVGLLLDDPFAGQVRVLPDAMELALRDFGPG